ncbi:MAG TPA: hypothetical protein VIF15_16470 [Polyangiaceae bacterium]
MRRAATPYGSRAVSVWCALRAVRVPACGAWVLLAGIAADGCYARPACDGLAPCSALAACPRDAARDASGRCRCAPGTTLVLGACVAPSVGDAYCGPGAHIAPEGCVFRECTADEALDVTAGCIPIASATQGRGGAACPPAAAPLVEDSRTACVPADAACPRGTQWLGAACARPHGCPAGTLATFGARGANGANGANGGRGCRPIVVGGDSSVVDLGSWALLALGADGALGSGELCRPLAQRPGAFGVARGESLPVRIRIGLVAPDQDVTRVEARVRARAESGRALPASAEALVERAVATLLEPLRGLGGQTSASSVEVEVRCLVSVSE